MIHSVIESNTLHYHSYLTCSERTRKICKEKHYKKTIRSLSMALSSSRSRSKQQKNPILQQFQKPARRNLSHSTNVHKANPKVIPANPLSPFRHIGVGVWEVEPVTSFVDDDDGIANHDQVGVDGLDLFLESPGTSSIVPPASPLFLMPRLRVSSGNLFS